MKKFVFGLLVMSLLLTMFAPVAYAAETEEIEETTVETTEGSAWVDDICGDNLTWSLDGGTLTVSGSGDMYDCTGGAPWEDDKAEITSVVFSGGVTYVGAEAFKGCKNLTSIDFGGVMYAIGPSAFENCTGLATISLPSTFRRFYEACFQGCTGLSKVYCTGSMPNFRANCLWTGNFITIYTATNNPWPQEHVEELVNNFRGRLEVVTGNGDSYYEYTEPTEAPIQAPITEPVTEPTTEPTTVPTEAPTEPATQPTTVPTEAVTEPSEEPETTVAATTAPDDAQRVDELLELEEGSTSRTMMYVFLGIAVLTLLLIIALIIRGISHKGGRYSD